MDLYTFIVMLTATIGLLICLGLFLYLFGVRPQIKKVMEESKKLQLKINQFSHELGEYGPEEMVQSGLGGMGIEGLVQSLNITPELLKSIGLPAWALPIAEGFIAKLKQKGASNEPQEKRHISQSDL